MFELRDDPSLYQTSAWQIFWRNFLAGFSRALGSLLVTVVILGIVTYLSLRALVPQLTPLVTLLQDAVNNLQGTTQALQSTQKSLNSLNTLNTGSVNSTAPGAAGIATPMNTQTLSPDTLNQLYQQLRTGQ